MSWVSIHDVLCTLESLHVDYNGSPAYVPLFAPSRLGSQSGTTEYPQRHFRHLIGQWLKTVKALWPECPADIVLDGDHLILMSSRACPAVRASSQL